MHGCQDGCVSGEVQASRDKRVAKDKAPASKKHVNRQNDAASTMMTPPKNNKAQREMSDDEDEVPLNRVALQSEQCKPLGSPGSSSSNALQAQDNSAPVASPDQQQSPPFLDENEKPVAKDHEKGRLSSESMMSCIEGEDSICSETEADGAESASPERQHHAHIEQRQRGEEALRRARLLYKEVMEEVKEAKNLVAKSKRCEDQDLDNGRGQESHKKARRAVQKSSKRKVRSFSDDESCES
jgi:hypothetical protein